jgi:hypothetical protein
MDIGIELSVQAVDLGYHTLGLLCRGGVVEIDERATMHGALKYGKVAAELGRIERRCHVSGLDCL